MDIIAIGSLILSLVFFFIIQLYCSKFFERMFVNRAWIRPVCSIPTGLVLWVVFMSLWVFPIIDRDFVGDVAREMHSFLKSRLSEARIATREQRVADALYERVSTAVVAIETYDSRGDWHGGGTGFFIDAEGSIATNAHVLAGAARAVASTITGEKFEISQIQGDASRVDLVICRVAVKTNGGVPLSHLELSGTEPRAGRRIFVVGNPQGLEFSLSEGIVAGVRRHEDGTTVLQLTAFVDYGSSGSPVVNVAGEVEGIASYALRPDAHHARVGFAISAQELAALPKNPQMTLAEWDNRRAGNADWQYLYDPNGTLAALEIYRDLTQKEPGNPAHWKRLARLANEANRNGEALNAWLKTLEIKGVSSEAVAGAADAYYALGQFEKALENYRTAARLMPRNPAIQAGLAKACNKLALYQEAAKASKQALRRDPGSDEAHFELGFAAARIGRMDQALEEYWKIKESDSSQQHSRKLISEITASRRH